MEQVIGWLVGIGIVVAGPAAIGFIVLGRRTHGRGVMVWLGIAVLVLGGPRGASGTGASPSSCSAPQCPWPPAWACSPTPG